MFDVSHRFAYMKKQDFSDFGLFLLSEVLTVMRRLTTAILSDFVVVRTS
jgi:hypothetical protein